MRTVHRLVLRSFAETGVPPEPSALAGAAAPFGPAAVLSELADGDHLWLDEAGQISAAYPFSARVTPHRVEITGGGAVHAMCAIDALGIAGMLRTSVRIWSRDMVTGEPIMIVVDSSPTRPRRTTPRHTTRRHGPAGRTTWHPATTVVFYGHSADAPTGPAALVCCSSINFFSSNATAASWASTHTHITGHVLNQVQAMRLANRVFGHLLD